MTPVGAAALCITAGVRFAGGRNVEFLKIMRILIHGLELAFRGDVDPKIVRSTEVRH